MRNLLSPPKRCLLLLLLLVSSSVWAQTPDDNIAFLKIFMASVADRDSFNTIPVALDARGNHVLAGTRLTDTQGANIVLRHYNASQEEDWAVQWNYSGSSDDFATSVIIDDSSNIYVSGYSFQAGSPYYQRLVVLKYNDAGVLQWQYIYGGTGGQPNHVHPYKLAMDGQNIYICGAETDSSYIHGFSLERDYLINPLPDTIANSFKMTLLRLNTNGTLAWRKQWDSPNNASYPSSVSVSGNYVYLVGQMRNDTLDSDIVIYKYNHSGTEQWNRHYSADISTLDRPKSAVTDSSGNIYMTGYTCDSASEESDILALKYEANGTLGWALRYDAPDTTANDWSNNIVYSNNHIYLLGQSDTDVVILKVLADDGTPAWTNRWDGSPDTNRWYDYPYGLSVNDSGTVFVGAYTSRYNNYPDDAVTFVMQQYDSDGNLSIEQEYNSGGFQGTFNLYWFVSRGWSEDTLGNIYMLVAYQQNIDTVDWTILKYEQQEFSVENPENPYDEVGIRHNEGVEYVLKNLSRLVSSDTISVLLKSGVDCEYSLGKSSQLEKKIVLLLLEKFSNDGISNPYDTTNYYALWNYLDTTELIPENYASLQPEEMYEISIQGDSLLTPYYHRLYLNRRSARGNSYVLNINTIKGIEQDVINDSVLSDTSKRVFLSSSSIGRYSTAFWANRINNRVSINQHHGIHPDFLEGENWQKAVDYDQQGYDWSVSRCISKHSYIGSFAYRMCDPDLVAYTDENGNFVTWGNIFDSTATLWSVFGPTYTAISNFISDL